MSRMLLNLFDQRQVMGRDNYEIFHYNNSASCACPPHQHDFYELFYLMDDTIDYIIEGLRYTLGPGSVMLIGPGQMHRPDVPGPVRDIDRFVLWISSDYLRAIAGSSPYLRYTLLDNMTGRSLIAPDADTGGMLRQLLFALHREMELDEPDNALMSWSVLTQIMIYLSRSIGAAGAVPHRAEFRYREIMRIYEYIVTHLKEDLSVSGLAEMFFMDKNTLTRQFKRQVGMTPGECIRRRRLEAAHVMISNGISMQDACAECGFSDYSAFYRAFRQAYGVSPSAFAASNEKKDA